MIGNKPIQEYFGRLIKSGNLSHAYLFFGPEAAGKKLLALEMAEKLCGTLAGNPDIKIIDSAGESIHISDIRDLKNFIYLTPFGEFKAAIINNAHNLTAEASNALLKALEEPPAKSVIFLITHLPEFILPTVSSRCQTVRFKPAGRKEIADFLTDFLKTEQNKAEFAARLSNGSPGLAVNLISNQKGFKENLIALEKMAKSSLAERFQFAKENSEKAFELAKDWLLYSALEVQNKSGLIREVLRLYRIAGRPQFNRRLALENFLINV